jgi:hypothetical protein
MMMMMMLWLMARYGVERGDVEWGLELGKFVVNKSTYLLG